MEEFGSFSRPFPREGEEEQLEAMVRVKGGGNWWVVLWEGGCWREGMMTGRESRSKGARDRSPRWARPRAGRAVCRRRGSVGCIGSAAGARERE